MKKIVVIIVLALGLVGITAIGNAWKFNSHKGSVIDAFRSMEGSSATPAQKWAVAFLKYTAGSDVADRCGQKNGDTDNFYDTSVGGWWVGYRTHVSLFGFDTNFTSYWHFVTMFRPGGNGNAYDGYSYRYSPDDGFWGYNGVVKSLLYNQDTKNAGNAGNNISYPEGGSGAREAYRFRFQLASALKYFSTTKGGNYDDYQTTVFEPCTNAAAYWYGRALNGRTPATLDRVHADYLGHVFHMAGDATVTQHVWDTLDHFHSEYEAWVDANYGTLYNAARVADLVAEFKAAHGIADGAGLRGLTLQQIISWFANRSVNLPAPLYTEDFEARFAAGTEEYNGSVAVNAVIIEKFVYDLYAEETARKF